MTAATQTYSVVTNNEGQYSTLRLLPDLPNGWRRCGITGTRSACLDYIEELWRDFLPHSVRDQMKSDAQEPVRE